VDEKLSSIERLPEDCGSWRVAHGPQILVWVKKTPNVLKSRDLQFSVSSFHIRFSETQTAGRFWSSVTTEFDGSLIDRER
jgi:hypothetical protein